MQLALADQHRATHCLAQGRHRRVTFRDRQQGREFVATEPGERCAIRPQHGLHPVRDLDQQRIAHRVAIRIVDLFEMVEVAVRQHHDGHVASRMQPCREPLQQAQPVPQAGQCIGGRPLGQRAVAGLYLERDMQPLRQFAHFGRDRGAVQGVPDQCMRSVDHQRLGR